MSDPIIVKENYIKSQQGNYKVSFYDKDGDKKNYESIMITPVYDKFKPTALPKELSSLSDVTKEFKFSLEHKVAIMDTQTVYTKDKEGYTQELKGGIFSYLNQNLAKPDNNTGIKPAQNKYVNSVENNEFIMNTVDGYKIYPKGH